MKPACLGAIARYRGGVGLKKELNQKSVKDEH